MLLSPKAALKIAAIAWLFSAMACTTSDAPSTAAPSEAAPAADWTAETQQMADRLATLAATGNPLDYYHWNSKQAAYWAGRLSVGTEQERIRAWYSYCEQSLLAGKPEVCIQQIEGYLSGHGNTREAQLTPQHKPLFELLAIAYLRLGEQQNCQAAHSPQSCIVPLQGAALHQLPEGSTKAAELYTLLQQHYPSPTNRWLLNLAHMTLGQHPKGVPANQLLPFPQPTEPTFSDVAMHVGLALNGLSGGTCVDDFNNDGLLDVFATSYGMTDNVRLMLNNGHGSFSDATEAAGLSGIVSGLNCVHADYDNDGFTDILVLRGAWLGAAGTHPNSLLKNLGNGQFADATAQAGLLSLHPTQTACWADFNRDGFLDLFIGNESGQGDPHPCELYKNNGDGTFSEVAAAHGLGKVTAFVKGSSWGDFNNDGWPDLYISVLGGNNMLFENRNGTFANVAAAQGVEEPFFSFPCWWWDVNNDGYQDLFVASYDLQNLSGLAGDYALELLGKEVTSEKPRLFLNRQGQGFEDVTEAWNINKTMYAMGANFGDLDNDGWLDFYVGTGAPDFQTVVPNRMFRNTGTPAGFEEVTAAGGFGHIQKGHGVAFADMDSDGDQDVYAVMGGAYEGDTFTNVLFENPGNKNNWIVLELEGTVSNRSGIGARLEIELENGRTLHRTVSTGGSFGASSLQQEIGLGTATEIARLVVRWPSGEVQEFSNLSSGQKVRITEGNGQIESLPYRAVPFSENGRQHHH